MGNAERRLQERAKRLWEEAGKPASGIDAYLDRARELIAIEEHQKDTLVPTGAQDKEAVEDDPIASDDVLGPEGEPIEPLQAVLNEGEFPTLTDQGEGEQVPHRQGEKVK
jgi:hypothetical protein